MDGYVVRRLVIIIINQSHKLRLKVTSKLINQVLRTIQIAVKSDVKTGRI